MQLVLFDFDGTLTRKDSLWAFLFFSKGPVKVLFSVIVLMPLFMLYGFRLVSGGYLKERLLRWHFKGQKQTDMQKLAVEFNAGNLRSLVRPEILNQLIAYKESGAEVCIVSASCDVWLRPFCEEYNCSYLTTEMEFVQGVFTGKFSTPNCNLEEKAFRIRSAYDLEKFENIIAFGNSSDDNSMFSLAHEIHKIE